MLAGLPQWYSQTNKNALGSNLAVSADAGYSWRAPGSAPAGRWGPVAMSCSGTRQLAIRSPRFGAAPFGLYTSTDAGVTWSYVDDPASPARQKQQPPWALATNDAGTRVAVGTNNAVFIGDGSGDGSYTWRQALSVADITRGNEPASMHAAMNGGGSKVVAWAAADGFSSEIENLNKVLYISEDGGQNWAQRTPAASTGGEDGSGYMKGVTVSADGTRIAAVWYRSQVIWLPDGSAGMNNGSIYTSSNGGLDWVRRDLGSKLSGSITASRDGSYVVAAGIMQRKGMLWVSTDAGSTWQQLTDMFLQVYDIACSSTCSTLAVLGRAQGDFSVVVYVRYDFATTFQRSASPSSQDPSAILYPLEEQYSYIAISTCDA